VDHLGFLFIAELDEDYMGTLGGLTSEDAYTFGEGLSVCLAALAYPNANLFWPNLSQWLYADNYARADHVNFQDSISIGWTSTSCNLMFINWLRSQGVTFAQLFTAINAVPDPAYGGSVYNKILGKTGLNPFPIFLDSVNSKIPAGTFPYTDAQFAAKFPGCDLWNTPAK